jgi:hypothetical protein
MCTKFQFDLMKISETTAIQILALFADPLCTLTKDPCLKMKQFFSSQVLVSYERL